MRADECPPRHHRKAAAAAALDTVLLLLRLLQQQQLMKAHHATGQRGDICSIMIPVWSQDASVLDTCACAALEVAPPAGQCNTATVLMRLLLLRGRRQQHLVGLKYHRLAAAPVQYLPLCLLLLLLRLRLRWRQQQLVEGHHGQASPPAPLQRLEPPGGRRAQQRLHGTGEKGNILCGYVISFRVMFLDCLSVR